MMREPRNLNRFPPDTPMTDRVLGRSEPNDNGCWIWWAATNDAGYGILTAFGEPWLAHRASYSAFIGDVPDEIFVCHKCDVPACVNPAHLFLGTHQDNMDDMCTKGRSNNVFGEDVYNSKLTVLQVMDIVHALRFTTTPAEILASKYNISAAVIWSIQTGTRWKHITANYLLPLRPLTIERLPVDTVKSIADDLRHGGLRHEDIAIKWGILRLTVSRINVGRSYAKITGASRSHKIRSKVVSERWIEK